MNNDVLLVYKIMSNTYDVNCDKNLFDLSLLHELERAINYYSRNSQFTMEMKKNITDFLSLVIKYEDQYRNDRVDKVFKLMNLMTDSKTQDSISFYRLELLTRTNSSRVLFQSKSNIEKQIDYINKSICFDYYVVSTHLDLTSLDDFNDIHLQNLDNSEFYPQSISALLNNCPNYFKNAEFYARTKQALFSNKYIDSKQAQKLLSKRK